MSGLVKGKVCIVTGAGKGIGKEITKSLCAEGAIVYAIEHHEGDILSWKKDLDYADNICEITADVTKIQDIKKIIMRIKKEYGKIDVLVNNAGVEYNERIGMISTDNMEKMFQVNVYSVIQMIQYCSRVMMFQETGGSIVNISSVVGVKGNPGQLVYSATKGAVISLTKSAAKELAPFKIRVNSVAPGLTNTDMVKKTAPEYLQDRISRIAMGRIAEPEDIANAVLFLASDLSEYVSGQILGVDGCTIM